MPNRQTTTTTGTLAPICLDWTLVPPTASWAAEVVTGTATYSVNYTLDDINDSTVTAKWWDAATAPANTTASSTGAFLTPARFVRLNVATISGTVAFTVMQGLPV